MLKIKDAQLTNASLHVSFLPNVIISLQLFDNDIEIASARGKGCATIRSVFMHLYDEPKIAELKKGAPTAVVVPAPSSNITKHKYVLQAKIETSIEKFTAPNDFRPYSNARASKPSSAKGKKKAAATNGNFGTPSQEDSRWKLRIVSPEPASFIVTKDTEKEDLFKSIKEGWEANAPGRIQSARELRDTYTKMVETSNFTPIVIPLDNRVVKPWTVIKENAPVVLITSEKELRPLSRIDTSDAKDEVLLNEAAITKQISPDIVASAKIQPAEAATVSTKGPSEGNLLTPFPKSMIDVGMNKISTTDIRGAAIKEEFKEMTVYKSVIVERGDAQVLEADHVQKSIQEQLTAIENSQKWIQEIRQHRASDKDVRALEKRLQVECVEIKQKEMEGWWKIDQASREAYRYRIIRESDELEVKIKAAQMAATKVLEQESMAAGEEVGTKKKGKK